MTTKYRISQDDYVNAANLFGKLTRLQAIVCICIVALLLIAAIFGPAAIKGAAIGGLIAGVAVALIIKYIVNPILLRRHYQKYKAIHEEFEIALIEDGIHITSPSGSGKVTWDSVFKWRQNDSYILIYPMPRLYYIVPKSLESNGFNITMLITQLTDNVGKPA
jgi:YcxB-like protein